MNEQLSVLRSLMPFFYAKRGDQATIIGGAVEYIKELQQVLQSLEAKKQRKAYGEVVLSPRPVPSPRPPHWSPRPPPLSPRMALPIGPRTPQPGSPYMPRMQQNYAPPTVPPSHESSPSFGSSASELTANSNSAVAEVEVKFSGPNVILKTVSHRIRGQVLKIVAALEGLALEILHVSISITDDTMLNSFTIKVRTTTTAHQMWFCWYSHSKMSSFSFLLLCLLTLSNKAASQDSL
ncbi:Helix-loop-helix DNA-binding domain [Musa troglodytarum]|nr:Helix-loop-helix DNA-binding domain [Musa troglodytarum]URE47657.1 Helix-loop-helix DNA-binding domain [Musa troglodytarum]